MAREKTSAPANYAVLSGDLGGELEKHARERCRHFFLYVFDAKVLTDLVNQYHSPALKYADAVLTKATHQIDDGFRSKNDVYNEFDSSDPAVINKMCTTFRRTDAAHFCNLGVRPTYLSTVNQYVARDEHVRDYVERLKSIMGNTRRLPQRVNIGPDRVIDKLHGDLAVPMMTSAELTVVCRDNIRQYLDEAISVMTIYQTGQNEKGNHGVGACAQSYLNCYNAVNIALDLYSELFGNVAGDCTAAGFDTSQYAD